MFKPKPYSYGMLYKTPAKLLFPFMPGVDPKNDWFYCPSKLGKFVNCYKFTFVYGCN
jgi:hypothetical protein